ncbi:TPCN1, partial [Symbiodinium necroappetens]
MVPVSSHWQWIVSGWETVVLGRAILYAGDEVWWLQNSFFAASHYWALNFNDILSGFVTLFSIMMVNNWFVIAGACILVTTEYSAIFFICFFVIVNLIVLNILIALILESSQAVREELQEPIELDLTLEEAQLP